MESVPKEADSVVSFGLQLCLISVEPDQGLLWWLNESGKSDKIKSFCEVENTNIENRN